MKKKAFFEITRSCNFCLTSHINCPCVAKCIYCIQHIVPISLNVYMHVRNVPLCICMCAEVSTNTFGCFIRPLAEAYLLVVWLSLSVCLSVCPCFCLLGCLTPVTESHALEQRAVHFWKAFTLPLSWLVDLVCGVPWRLSCELTHASCGRLLGPHDGGGGCVFKHQTLPETKTL